MLPAAVLRCHYCRTMEKPSTDSQLVDAARSGNLAAFETLVTRHGNRLFRQALAYLHVEEDARDAVQEAFLTSFTRLDSLADPPRFLSWISRILRNCCLNRLRQNRRRQALNESVSRTTERGQTAEPPILHKVAFRVLLARLPRPSVRVFTLHYLDGYSIQDVALLVGATQGAVKQRLYRARKQLQKEVVRMARDERSRNDLPDGFVAQTIARLLEQGRTDRLYLRMDAARARFREALEVCPDHPDATMELGRTSDPIEGASEEEVATLQRAERALPDSIDVALALAAARRDDPKDHERTIERCFELCDIRLTQFPDDIVALTAKAQIFLWKRDFKAMEAVSRRAAELAPGDQKCLNYLALSLARQNRWECALPVYERLYGLDTKTVWAYVALRQMGTYLAFHRSDWKRAVVMQEKVWSLTGRLNEAGNLIFYYGRAGMIQEAKALFRRVRHHRHPARVYEIVGEEA